MADNVGYFQIVNPDEQGWFGGYKAKNASELRNGILCKIDSDGKLSACTTNDAPDGFAYDNRTLVYRPESIYAAADESVTLVRGANVRFLADWSNFVGGSLPSFGDHLYTGATGHIAINTGVAAGYIGRCIGTDDYRVPPNTTENLVLCEAKFLV